MGQGEQAFETTQEKFFPLSPWAAAVSSKPETLVQWSMKSEPQVWGGRALALPQAPVLPAHRWWVSLPQPLHSSACHGAGTSRGSLGPELTVHYSRPSLILVYTANLILLPKKIKKKERKKAKRIDTK